MTSPVHKTSQITAAGADSDFPPGSMHLQAFDDVHDDNYYNLALCVSRDKSFVFVGDMPSPNELEESLFDYTASINSITGLQQRGLPCRASHIFGLALKEIKKDKKEDTEQGYQAVLNRIMAESREALALLQLGLDNQLLHDINPPFFPDVIDSSGLPIHLTPRLAAAPAPHPRLLD